jgi:hypothetical protein
MDQFGLLGNTIGKIMQKVTFWCIVFQTDIEWHAG